MEYRSFADLSQTISANIHKLPRSVDLIVGIPRSGLMAGNLIALYQHLPIVDLDGFIENSKINHESSLSRRDILTYPREAKHVLLVDDTIYAGTSMAHAKSLIRNASINQQITSCAVYANPRSTHLVDIYFEELTSPGCQEWNIMHRDKLENFCVDIDGVLCSDPLKKEDDDGAAYKVFLQNARPLILPSHKIGWLVTGRLEKYRNETEAWLSRYNIQYKKLFMLNLPDAETRWKLKAAAKFKANVYRSLAHSNLFIESDPKQALEIAQLSGKNVLCFSDQKLHIPTFSAEQFRVKVRNYRSWAYKKAKRLARFK